MTTAKDVQDAIAAVEKSITPDVDDQGAKALLAVLRTFAARIETVYSESRLRFVDREPTSVPVHISHLRSPGDSPTYATPPGFEVRSFAEAASFGGFTLGYHEEVGQFVLRKTEDGDMPGTGFKWIAPKTQSPALEEALLKRDRDWCLAYRAAAIAAVGEGSGLAAPLVPEAIAENIAALVARVREPRG